MSSAQHMRDQFQATRHLTIVLSLFITQAFGTTYYVSSSSGSDSYSGTSSSSPWKTITKVNGRSYMPGDFVLFKTGDTWIGSNFSKTLSTPSAGISGNQITYGSYGSGAAPILDGNNSVGTAVRISRNYVTINGFQIRNVTGVLIDYTGTTGTNILNIAGKNAGVWGYRAGSGAGNTLIDHTSCSVDSGHSIRGWCYQAIGTGSIKLTHNTCDLSLTTTGACMEIFGSSTSVMQYNTAHGGSQAFSLKSVGGTACTGPAQTGGLIADNYADGISSANGDGEAIELTGCSGFPQRGVTVTRNVVICKGGGWKHGTSDAIGSFYSNNDIISANVIIGPCGSDPLTDAPSLMHLSSNATGLQIYNNTLYGSGKTNQIAVNLVSGSGTVRNNIIGNVARGIYNQGSLPVTEDYNIYMANVKSPYSGVSSGGHSKRSTDPKFMTSPPVQAIDTRLQATSPAIRAGANLGSPFSSILSPLGVVSPFGIFDQSLGWMLGAFGYAVAEATPTFIPPAGAYSSAQSVSILDSSVGATIYYTTNGATPTVSSSVYTGPIAVSATTTIKALAVGGALSASGVGSATYTIQ